MIIRPQEQNAVDLYKLLTGSALPRPIAFVTTKSEGGIVNAAPFSYYNIVTGKPPRVSIVIAHTKDGLKDTARHIIANKSFVINVVSESMLEDMNRTSASLPPFESEIDLTSFTLTESELVFPPQIEQSLIRLECILDRRICFDTADMFIGEVVLFHVHESVYNDGKIDVNVLKPVGRLAGNQYAKLGEIITLERPK